MTETGVIQLFVKPDCQCRFGVGEGRSKRAFDENLNVKAVAV